ncbi:MAG: prepilin-type N-terminal cleavage/methylation domain-containing protein [Deltaproteobacteria bacterium]|nr:MAG: prepilin-type N-terminal cleavage/methylation domain-containing protein [Deltaproteobacteria bacterium]
MMTISARSLRQRGFTLIEIMLVLAIIGCLSILCIPLFQRFAARARKAEMHNVLGKVELNFRNNYQSTGVYGADITSDFNPPLPAGPGAPWNPTLTGWQTYPFPPDGSLRLRYQYIIKNSGKTLILKAQGEFIGLPTTWKYEIQYDNGNPSQLGGQETPFEL